MGGRWSRGVVVTGFVWRCVVGSETEGLIDVGCDGEGKEK